MPEIRDEDDIYSRQVNPRNSGDICWCRCTRKVAELITITIDGDEYELHLCRTHAQAFFAGKEPGDATGSGRWPLRKKAE